MISCELVPPSSNLHPVTGTCTSQLTPILISLHRPGFSREWNPALVWRTPTPLWHWGRFSNNPSACCLLLWFPLPLPDFGCPGEKFHPAAGITRDHAFLSFSEATCHHRLRLSPHDRSNCYSNLSLSFLFQPSTSTPSSSFWKNHLNAWASFSPAHSLSYSLIAFNPHSHGPFSCSFSWYTQCSVSKDAFQGSSENCCLIILQVSASAFFLWYTLLFSLWGFYSKHVAQPVIKHLYVCFLLNGCSVDGVCEARAFAHYQTTQILANCLAWRVD